ncbi:MAG: hypothetical protein M1419_09610 [Bacteroidetes bacterium]|nr:hypothetical protein [Bacteroidota bacterium]
MQYFIFVIAQVKKYFILLVYTFLSLFIIISCKDNTDNPVDIKYTNEGKTSIVIIVETLQVLGYETLSGFELYRNEIIPIFSELFKVPESELEGLSLNDIVDKYGEEWQIREIAEAAKKKYDKIITMTDSMASCNNFLDSIKYLSNNGYYIDVIFSLHGSSNSVRFYDKSVNISELTQKIKSNNVKIRVIYQTCCTGKEMIDDWEKIDVLAVNGAVGLNGINLFSPQYFLEEWTNGKTYEESVYIAFNKDIEKVKSYNSTVPVIEYLLTDETITNSRQFVGGLDKKILWNNFPIYQALNFGNEWKNLHF